MRRLRRTGHVAVALPLVQALRLFTPEGERDWVDGWAPTYAEDGADDTEPGTVFTTDAHGRTTTWVVADRRVDGYRYIRVVPGHSAGTVTVAAVAIGATACAVTVTYDLSALSADGERFLATMADTFVDHLAGWESAIAALPAGPGDRS